MSLAFEDVSVDIPAPPVDEAPETTNDAHYCQEPGCVNETFRKGDRGRWPKYCDDHKKRPASGSSAKRSSPAQAKQAATVLGQFNDLLTVSLSAVSMVPQVPLDFSHTASALASVNEAFVEQAEQALSTDPALCRAILRVGKMGGRTALAMAYVSLGVGIAPGIMADVAAMREGRNNGAQR